MNVQMCAIDVRTKNIPSKMEKEFCNIYITHSVIIVHDHQVYEH